jgi:trk system potassium uptake protein TrkH
MWLNGPRALVLSFVALIVIGTLILMLPAMSAPGHSLAWVDALFLATSAACVTGLATVNYADMLSTAGHATLLVLFQLGGLGIMTFSAAFAALLGRGISPSNHLALSDAFSGGRSIHLNRLLYYSLAICFVTEAMGAVAIYALLDSDTPTGHRIWTAIFHSVSAFCNAGFSIYPENLMRWQHNRAAATVVMALIIVGGLGFFVVLDLIDWRQGRTPFFAPSDKTCSLLERDVDRVGGDLHLHERARQSSDSGAFVGA